MGPKKGGKKGKGKKAKDEGPQGPTPEELLAQIAVLNVAKDKETQERNLMMLERVRTSFFFIHLSRIVRAEILENCFSQRIFITLVACWKTQSVFNEL